ncbi:hypothetical protein EMCRGX_G018950 [Ephydatia muelleri]
METTSAAIARAERGAGREALARAKEAAKEDVMGAGVWPLLKDLEDPELRRLAQSLPATVLRSRADSTTKKYLGAYQRWKDMGRGQTRSTRIPSGLESVGTSPIVQATLAGLRRMLARPKSRKEPVTADMLKEMVEAAGPDPSLTDVRAISKTKLGEKLRKGGRLSYSRARKLLLEKIKSMGMDPALFGMHSLRAGGATAAANAGVPDRLFKRHDRWKSESAKDGPARSHSITDLFINIPGTTTVTSHHPSPPPQDLLFEKPFGRIQDYVTKWADARPLPDQTASRITTELMDPFITYGIPEIVHSEQGRNVESTIFQQVLKAFGVMKSRTTSYHPQGDGMVEKFNRTLLQLLQTICHQPVRDTLNLPPTAYAPGEYGKTQHAKLAELTNLVEVYMAEAAEERRQQYNKHSEERFFEVDDPVWLFIPTAEKLDPRWEGNWVVTGCKSPVNVHISGGARSSTYEQGQNITWNGQLVRNNSLVSLSIVPNRVSSSAPPQYPLVCQGITGGQWYEPNGVLFPLATPDPVSTPGGLGQQNVSGGVELYRGTPPVFPHGVQCCTNTTITLCVGMYSDLTLAASVSLPTSKGYSFALSVAATYGPNITGGVQFQLLTPTNVDPPVFQLTCTSTSSPPTDVLWTTNGSPVSNTSSQIVTDRPTSTYNNTLTVTGRAYGMYTCTVTTTCSPVCGGPGFNLNPRSTTSSLTVQAPPGPPTGVTAVQSGLTSVSVSWTAPTSGGPVTRYDIYYVANGGPSTSGGSTNSTTYVLTNLQVGVQYNISVIAVGIFVPSLSANVTKTLIPSTPSLIIAQVTSTSITAMWDHVLELEVVGVCLLVNATQYTITGLQEFSAYILTITASIGVGSSPPASVLVNTSSAAPSPPNNLTEVNKTSSSVTISWGEVPCQDQNSVIVEYRVLYGAVTSGVGGTVATSGRTLTVNGLSPYTNYSIEVSAVNSDGAMGPYSSPLFVVTDQSTAPGPVTGLQAFNKTFTTITLTWQPPPVPNGVIIMYQVTYSTNGVVNTNNTTTPPVTVTGLVPRTTYTFSVTAYTITGPGTPLQVQTSTADIPNVNGVMVSAINTTSVLVSWLAVQLPPDGILTGYTVYYLSLPNTSKRQSGGYTNQTFPPTSTSGDINNLNPNGVYQFSVVAQVNITGQLYSGAIPSSGSTIATEGSPTSAAGGAAIGGAVGGVIGGLVGGVVGGVVLVLIAAAVVVVIVILLRHKGQDTTRSVTNTSPYEKVKKTTSHTTEMDTIDTGKIEEVQYATISGEPARQAPSIKEFPSDSDVVDGEEVVFNVRVTGYPRPSFTWYRNGTKMTTDHSFTLGKDGSLVIHTAEMGHAGVYELEVANELGVDKRRVSLGVYGSEIELPGDYQMTVPAVPLAKFGPYVAKSHEKNNVGFTNQYRSLESTTKRPSTVALSSENKSLNRFANIVPYDENLIQLSPMEGQQDCQKSYINASYIAGYPEPKKFIATQGPLPSTVVDLWRLVWQEGVSTIVMVTNIKEDGKVKCQQYWAESGRQKYGPFSVAITEQKDFADYVIRVFEVTLSRSAVRKVTQFHFTAWPDHGVPEYATSLLAFHRKVKSQHDGSKGPILVHCSAGVGRTGTLIAIDTVLEQIEKEGLVDIAGTIRKMRWQRMKMVQTPDQYIFLHDAILESVMCGNTQIQASSIHISLNTFETKDPTSNKTGLESQFEVLEQVSPDPKSVRRDVALEEAGKNRSMDYLPPDRYRVILKQEYPDYINATFVNGYKQQKAFIIAQGPLKSTCRDFWKMVCDRKCGAIVMLSQLEEGGKVSGWSVRWCPDCSYPGGMQEVCHQYWPDQGIESYGEFTIESGEQEARDGYTIRTLYLAAAKVGVT